ncbi:tRNA-specific 2-thiouridylase [Quillaja saponaria]|uniref:tRNA-specific 2-thiouridylase n=1 Tax=Quillaja saponaria TaxID=32244 RepID=A0AAD7VJ75_QUISA|nr:tRNA-specific 2-thiouridylase [Quillaja saponaria]
MLQMGFQNLVGGGMRSSYKRLTDSDEKLARPRRGWVKNMNGRLKGLRLSRSRKLSLKSFSVILMPSRIARIYNDFASKMVKIEGVYPTLVFPTQLGLPVLSHPSIKCRKRVISPDRKMTCFQ